MQRSCRNIEDLFAAINRTVPAGSVIASDPITSYSIPAFTDGYVVCTYDQHSIPNDSTALARILACRDLYRSTASMKELGGILERYGAGYVAINGRIPSYLRSNYWIPDSADAAGAVHRFSAAPELFECVYEHESVSLFRFTPGTYTGYAAPDAAHLGRAVTAAELPGLVETAVSGVYLEQAFLSRSRVTRGDTLMLYLIYVAEETSPPGSYVTFVRFDTDFEKGTLYHPAYGKVYRKLIERVSGHRYRFRVDHLPLHGVLPPDRWPPLREIFDHLLIRVPKDISPGDYVVSVKLTPRPHSANYTMRDLFTDDDFYSGTPVASVRIE
jgi:hypothetical protein